MKSHVRRGTVGAVEVDRERLDAVDDRELAELQLVDGCGDGQSASGIGGDGAPWITVSIRTVWPNEGL